MALPDPPGTPSVLVIGCGALAGELLDIVKQNGLTNISVACLPAVLHNHPDRIPGAVDDRLTQATGYDSVFVAYADCGTGGALDRVLAKHGVDRLPGAHCYEFFAGRSAFASLHDEEPGTFYLTDFLTTHFDRLIWHGLGLDRWPDLRDDYFGNYRRVVYLAQTNNADLTEQARAAASRLGLAFERRQVGYGEMEPALVHISAAMVPA